MANAKMKNTQTVSVQAAIEAIQSGDHVFIHSVAAAPQALLGGLIGQAGRLEGVRLYHIHTEGQALYAQAAYQNSFSDYSFSNTSRSSG